ncbi:MAG: hypoxanthine phosphoribosyltransferase [Brumimicrobium sp.]|nr:hypoxanthine phosphoribosyltransferase [Brumimicrobium sp.]
MQIKDKDFELYIKELDIQKAVSRLAERINSDYEGKNLIFIGVLNGSFMFASDLLKQIHLPCEISFIKVSSYKGVSSIGKVHELIGLNNDLKGKHVVILEDIVDTGLTLDKIYSMIEHDEPDSLEVSCLLFKPDAFEGKRAPKYFGLEIPNEFVVGYGLDYLEEGRNSKEIYKLKE